MLGGSAVLSRLMAPAVAVTLLAAACAGSGGADPAGSSPQDREEAVLGFAQCMREQGIDMPDPVVDESGRVRIRAPHGSTAGERMSDPAFMEAREACGEHLQRGVQEHEPGHESEMQDRALAFAQCMRAHGVDMPDPDFSGGARIRFNPFADADLDDPEVQEVIETCREEAFGAQGPGGGMFIGGRR